MSFINWGNESPEQRALRKRLEDQAIYEQAVRVARNRGNNAMFGGAGSGGAGSSQIGNVYYLRAFASSGEDNSEPWDETSNVDEMNAVFGEGGWTLATFESADVASIFSAATSYVFMDGSDRGAENLAEFLDIHYTTIQEWVFAGGALFLNAAPNEGGNIDFHFGAITLVDDNASQDVTVAEGAANHPIFLGPGNCGTDWTGDDFSHAILEGGGLIPLIVNPVPQIVCAELSWGAGKVIFGGMTITQWQDPKPEVIYLRQNIHSYLSGKSYSPMLGLRQMSFREGKSSRDRSI